MTRRLIVVDTETTGLDLVADRPVEVAWHEWRGTGAAVFVPPHSLLGASPEALKVNGYYERIAGRGQDGAYVATGQLHVALDGATLAGANVRFDAAMLAHLFRDAGMRPDPFHHRLLDIEAYAAGVLGIGPHEVPGLRDLCRLLNLPEPTHGAWEDMCAAVGVLDQVVPPALVPGVA